MAEKTISNPGSDTAGDADEQSPQRTRNTEKPRFLTKIFPFLRARDNSSSDTVDANGKTRATLLSRERAMLDNIVRLHQARVGDVMIPRSEIEAVEVGTTLADTLQLFEHSGHSRLPVYAETLDDPRGMIHIRDVLNYITRTARIEATSKILDFSRVDLSKTLGELGVIREVLFVPDSMPASQLLTRMQTTRTQMALVIDEHGGTDGLASMEDVFEVVVGDIEDEHDDSDVMINAEGADCWLVDGRAELEEIEDIIGSDFDPGEPGEEVDTIGGLIVSVLDRIPTRGETIKAIPGFSFQILDADRRRIRRLRIKRLGISAPQ